MTTTIFAILALLLGLLHLILGAYFLVNLDWSADILGSIRQPFDIVTWRSNMQFTAIIFLGVGFASTVAAVGLFRRTNAGRTVWLFTISAAAVFSAFEVSWRSLAAQATIEHYLETALVMLLLVWSWVHFTRPAVRDEFRSRAAA